MFLAINRVRDYLRLNGILMGVGQVRAAVRCWPVPVRSGSTPRSAERSCCCGVASLWVIYRHVGGSPSLSPSRDLLDARRFAGAGYVTYVLTVLPLLVYPLLVINALGSSAGGAYFISSRSSRCINAVILAVANSAYAESERAPTGRHGWCARAD